MSDTETHSPIIVYGSRISYFTGKVEAALRYKELPYEFRPMTAAMQQHDIPRATGVFQMPALRLASGEWLTDSTPILGWLDREFPSHRLLPQDPVQAFFCLLLEDYADEWLWRPAMHFRWHYRADSALLSRTIVEEMAAEVPLPGMLKRQFVRWRQRLLFTVGDGVSAATRTHVEGIYLRTLATLEAILQVRPFLLGDRPSVADLGFFASMFRHFSMDPTPAEIMRRTAPAVYAWVARMWAARGSRGQGQWLDGIPGDWGPLIDDIGAAYLPYLRANADACGRGKKRFDLTVQATGYRGLRSSRYRVWCLEQLQHHFQNLGPGDKAAVAALLERHCCLAQIETAPPVRSGHDPLRQAPFSKGMGMLGL